MISNKQALFIFVVMMIDEGNTERTIQKEIIGGGW